MRILFHAALLLMLLHVGAMPAAAQVTGACCFDETGCFDLTAQECSDQQGDYQGDGTTCDSGVCAGACCFFEGACVYIASPHTCWFDLNGTWMGAGTTCDPNPCPVYPRGACCLGAECVLWEEQHCVVEHGQWFGPESTCEPTSPCTNVVTGACCDTYGFCTQITFYECVHQGGTYMDDGTNCDPNPCEQTVFGACCFADQPCEFLAWPLCLAQGGTFQGSNLPCSSAQCAPFGACCLGVDCTVLTEGDCLGLQGQWIGDYTTCEPNPCPPVAIAPGTWGEIKARYR